jgi:hypothetical protein
MTSSKKAWLSAIAVFAIVLGVFFIASSFKAEETATIAVEYYLDSETGQYLEKSTNGECRTGIGFCSYTANRENPDPNEPSHFDPVPSSKDLIWIP